MAKIVGDKYKNTLTGDSADDLIFGYSNDDMLIGNEGNDRLFGGNGNDVMYGNVGNDVLFGGNGNDELYGNEGNDKLVGGSGSDHLSGNQGDDVMEGGADGDIYYVDSIGDQVIEADGENKVDTVVSKISYALPTGVENLVLWTQSGLGDLTGIGNESNNQIKGNGGNNVLYGAGGDDVLFGDEFSSYQHGDDYLLGGEGDDYLNGVKGADRLEGGTGNDWYVVDNTDVIIENADSGIDSVVVDFSYSLANTQLENLYFDTMRYDNLNGSGNRLDNIIWGNSGDNILRGGAGNDTLFGGYSGDDKLFGGQGDDILKGRGRMTGGTGNDVFKFDGSTVVTDFVQGEDMLDFTAYSWHNFTFIDDQAFSSIDPTDQLRFDAQTHELQGRFDATPDGLFIIKLTGVDTLSAADLIL